MFSNPDLALQVSHISKCFQMYRSPSDRLKQFLFPRIKNFLGKSSPPYYQEFWALKDITFDLPKGKTIGIVGKNGSGKSTLLQIITGTLTPTTGTMQTNGRIAALLELGAGFNLDFSGIDNIYLNASLLGLSKEEIDAKLDDILAFADIGGFVHGPVKTYSSGMLVRLAFAIQAQIEPEILIVDEALAVGDAKFQAKCFSRLKTLKENGTSILFVSHATEQVISHCDYAILLDQGEIKEQGQPKVVINHYLDLLFGKPKIANAVRIETEQQISRAVQGEGERLNREIQQENESQRVIDRFLPGQLFETHAHYNANEYRWGDGAATIMDFYVEQNGCVYPKSFSPLEDILWTFKIHINHTIIRPIFGFAVKTKEGITIYNSNTEKQGIELLPVAGNQLFLSVKLPNVLAQGDYFISVGLASYSLQGEIVPHDRRYDAIHLNVEPTPFFEGLADLRATFSVN